MGEAEVQIPLCLLFWKLKMGRKWPISSSLGPSSSKGKSWAILNLFWRWGCAEVVLSTSEFIRVLGCLFLFLFKLLLSFNCSVPPWPSWWGISMPSCPVWWLSTHQTQSWAISAKSAENCPLKMHLTLCCLSRTKQSAQGLRSRRGEGCRSQGLHSLGKVYCVPISQSIT